MADPLDQQLANQPCKALAQSKKIKKKHLYKSELNLTFAWAHLHYYWGVKPRAREQACMEGSSMKGTQHNRLPLSSLKFVYGYLVPLVRSIFALHIDSGGILKITRPTFKNTQKL